MTEIVADIDVSGEGNTADPAQTQAIVQGVALLRTFIARIEDEHGLVGLDILLSTYVSMAVERIGVGRTIEMLGNTRQRLFEIALQHETRT
jgi:hypothetical protein